MSGSGPFDAGLQPERTSLAWRRTALSIVLGSIVALRLLPAHFENPAWLAPGLFGAVGGVALWAAASRRFAGFTAATALHPPRLGGAILLVTTLLAAGVGGVGIGVIALSLTP